jgi:hypothetical protein
VRIITEQNGTNVIFFQVEYHSNRAAGELQKFPCHCSLQTIYAGNTVPNIYNRAHIADLDLGLVALNLLS